MLEVIIALEEDFLIIFIADAEVGISLQNQLRIFSFFELGEKKLDWIHECAGLDLALGKSFVELLQQHIVLRSKEGCWTPSCSSFQRNRRKGIGKLPIPRHWPSSGRVSVAEVDVVPAGFDIGW